MDKAVGKIEKLTKLQADLRKEVSATYSNKQLDEALAKLEKQTESIGKLNAEYGDAAKEIKRLQQEIDALTQSTAGSTAELVKLQKELGATTNKADELKKAVKEAAGNPEVFKSLIGTVKALKMAFSSTSTLLKSLGADTTAFENIAKSLTGAIEELEAAQSLMNAVVGEGSIATKALAAAQAAYTAILTTCSSAAKLFRTALAGLGIGVLVIAIGVLVENWDKLKNAVSGNSEGFKKFTAIVSTLFPPLGLLIKGIQYAVQNFDKLKEVIGGIGSVAALVFGKLGDSIGAVLSGQLGQLKEIWKDAGKQIEQKFAEGRQLVKDRTFLDKQLEEADFALKLAETTGKGVYQAKKRYMELEIKDLKSKNEDTRLLEAELTKLIEDEQARRTAAWKAAVEKQKQIDKEKQDAVIARNQRYIEDEIAAIETKLIEVKKGSDEEVQLFKEMIDAKIELAKADPSLSKEKLGLRVAQYKKEGADYLAQLAQNKAAEQKIKDDAALQQQDADNNAYIEKYNLDKKALGELKTNHDLQLQLQKDFNLTQEQVDAEFAASSFATFAAYEQNKRDEAAKTKDKQIELANQVFDALQQTAGQLKQVTDAFFAAGTQALETKLSNELGLIEEQKQGELKAAGDNAKLKEEAEARATKKKEETERKSRIEMAKLQRKQAIANKIFAVFDIGIKTAQAVMMAFASTGPLAGAPLAALAAAIGAIQLAAVAAAPLPAIPQYEKGGPVVLGGGRIADGHLYGRSHRRGGMLINAQGGEYIWDIPTVKKHGDLIRAAHENRLEDLIMHKYIAPALQRTTQPVAQQNTYDDFMLRATIKQGHEKDRRNAEYIADKVSGALTSTIYFQKRYR